MCTRGGAGRGGSGVNAGRGGAGRRTRLSTRPSARAGRGAAAASAPTCEAWAALRGAHSRGTRGAALERCCSGKVSSVVGMSTIPFTEIISHKVWKLSSD